MDRLTLVIAVSDVLLNVYSTKQERADRLTKKYGAKGAEEIQKEVNFCLGSNLEDKYMAVACIAGIAEACPDVLQFVTDIIQNDHQRTVGDEIALAAVAVLADEIVESAVSVLAVCLLCFNRTGIHFSHDAPNVCIVYNRM